MNKVNEKVSIITWLFLIPNIIFTVLWFTDFPFQILKYLYDCVILPLMLLTNFKRHWDKYSIYEIYLDYFLVCALVITSMFISFLNWGLRDLNVEGAWNIYNIDKGTKAVIVWQVYIALGVIGAFALNEHLFKFTKK